MRLVVDTGIHAMKWSREQATNSMSTRWATRKRRDHRDRPLLRHAGPGLRLHAGQADLLAARKKARAALGARFDIKSFHDAMLIGGAVPLAMIDPMTDRYIASRKSA